MQKQSRSSGHVGLLYVNKRVSIEYGKETPVLLKTTYDDDVSDAQWPPPHEVTTRQGLSPLCAVSGQAQRVGPGRWLLGMTLVRPGQLLLEKGTQIGRMAGLRREAIPVILPQPPHDSNAAKLHIGSLVRFDDGVIVELIHHYNDDLWYVQILRDPMRPDLHHRSETALMTTGDLATGENLSDRLGVGARVKIPEEDGAGPLRVTVLGRLLPEDNPVAPMTLYRVCLYSYPQVPQMEGAITEMAAHHLVPSLDNTEVTEGQLLVD